MQQIQDLIAKLNGKPSEEEEKEEEEENEFDRM